MFRWLARKLRSAFVGTEVDARVAPPSAQKSRVSGDRDVFFPTTVGSTWLYKIRIGSAEPLVYRQTEWPMPNGRIMGVATRGRFAALIRDRDRREFELQLAVSTTAAKQGPLQYDAGVRLTVLKDELGIYDEHQDLFWAIERGERLAAVEVVAYPSHASSAPYGHTFMGASGHCVRPRYFAGDPGMYIGLGDNPVETLRFEGVDDLRSRRWKTDVQRLVREVRASDSTQGERSALDSGFHETMWFGLGMGLVELVQTIDGETSMRWELQP